MSEVSVNYFAFCPVSFFGAFACYIPQITFKKKAYLKSWFEYKNQLFVH